MNCQLCGKRLATVCLNIDMNGERSTLFICDECAEERNLKNNPSPAEVIAVINEIKEKSKVSSEQKSESDNRVCSMCGMTYAKFRETSLLGCPDCYKSFADLLEPLLDRITKPQEVEQAPQPTASTPINNNLLKLQLQLKRCIDSEKYEEAAKIRDEINALKSEPEEKTDGKDE